MIIKLQLSQHQLFYFRYPSGKHHKNRSTRSVFHVNYQFSSFKNNQHSERRSIRLVSKSPLATKMQNRYIKYHRWPPSYQIVNNEKQQKVVQISCQSHKAKAKPWTTSFNQHQPLDFLPLFSFGISACELLSNPIYKYPKDLMAKCRRRIMRAISGRRNLIL